MIIKLYLLALPIFLIIDALWLTVISKGFYQKNIGFLMTNNPNLISAGIFYLIFILGLVILVIKPSLDNNSITQLISYSILFGLVTYSTYDLTNLATIKNWPIIVTIVDIIWGISISLIVSLLTYILYKKIF